MGTWNHEHFVLFVASLIIQTTVTECMPPPDDAYKLMHSVVFECAVHRFDGASSQAASCIFTEKYANVRTLSHRQPMICRCQSTQRPHRVFILEHIQHRKAVQTRKHEMTFKLKSYHTQSTGRVTKHSTNEN